MTMNSRYRFGIVLMLALCFSTGVYGQRVTQISPPNITFRGISFIDQNHLLLVGDSARITIEASLNGWNSWTSQNPSVPCSKSHAFYGVDCYSTHNAIVVGDDGLIFLSSGGLLNWTQSGAGLTNLTLRAVTHCPNGVTLIVGDSGIILRSTDTGSTWSKIESSTVHNIYSVAINAEGYGYFVGEHGLIGKTTDFGQTWPSVTDTNAFGKFATTPVTLRGVAIAYGDTAVVVGDSGAVRGTFDGNTWYPFGAEGWNNTPLDYSSSIIFGRTSFQSVCFMGNYLYHDSTYSAFWVCSSSGLMLQVSLFIPGLDTFVVSCYTLQGDADGGVDTIAFNFDCAASYQDSNFAFSGWYERQFINYDPGNSPWNFFLFASIDSLGDGFATGTGGALLKTTNNGLSWSQPFDNPNYEATDIYTFDAQNAFAVGWKGSMFWTSDGGAIWDSTIIAEANQERLHGIAHPADNVFVVCGDFGTIIQSNDNSHTWDASIVPTTNYLESIAFSSAEIGIAAGQNGTIIRTTDQGVTWMNINNPLTGTGYNFRQLSAFHDGTYYATSDSAGLWRSTDGGLNWQSIQNIPQTFGMGFYNEKVGVVAESAWSSGIVNDTMKVAFTRDGFVTVTEVSFPILTHDRVVIHFLDSSSFLCLGLGFVVKVEMSPAGASVTNISSPQISPIEAFPNPSATHSITVEYDLDQSGPTTVELWNELGEEVQSLFTGDEGAGHHSQQLSINPEWHGGFFLKVISGAETKMLPIVVE
jgi:photosystem II stability/assembly factor-like uncharacterized protein